MFLAMGKKPPKNADYDFFVGYSDHPALLTTIKKLTGQMPVQMGEGIYYENGDVNGILWVFEMQYQGKKYNFVVCHYTWWDTLQKFDLDCVQVAINHAGKVTATDRFKRFWESKVCFFRRNTSTNTARLMGRVYKYIQRLPGYTFRVDPEENEGTRNKVYEEKRANASL